MEKTIMSNYDAIECSGDAIRITNRLLDLTEACSDIHRSPQLLRSSEIGPIDHERSLLWIHPGEVSQAG